MNATRQRTFRFHYPKPAPVFRVASNTPCEVRKIGASEWMRHVTRLNRVFGSFAWRDETHYGFVLDGWEMKVEVEHVGEITRR